MAGGEMIRREDSKLWSALHELKAWAEGEVAKFGLILTGVDGTNGINGNLKKLHADHEATKSELGRVEGKLDQAISTCTHIWEVERFKDGKCIGANEVKKLREEMARTSEVEASREREHRKLLYGMFGAIVVSLISTAGTILVALISKGAK